MKYLDLNLASNLDDKNLSIELDSLNLLKELDFNDFELENNSIELARKKWLYFAKLLLLMFA
ncbi:hypothetical protein [Mesomycoplasma conjunctivae]|uniref:hypothetical protein n=1 Tax=Mesomycoplasma conjunctivae TaxID=45361 RepID=UPI003DA3B4A9